MKKNLLIFMASAIFSSPFLQAEDVVDIIYSTEGYCVFANEGVSEEYLNAYAKKLGIKPSVRVCKSFQEIVAESQPKDWDYPEGRVYPGSGVMLSPAQVTLLKALKKSGK